MRHDHVVSTALAANTSATQKSVGYCRVYVVSTALAANTSATSRRSSEATISIWFQQP